MNSKGQAAVTDALYFLMIITGLCIFMFTFANSYGQTVSEQISRQYITDYSGSALKSVLYSSCPRHEGQSIYSKEAAAGNIEIDYLLALIKEDYADDKSLSDNTKNVLKDTVSSVMKPIADNYDYLFYIHKTTPTGEEFAFAFLHRTTFERGETGPGHAVEITPTGTGHKDSFCSPSIEAIDKLMIEVSNPAHSSTGILLMEEVEKKSPESVQAQADLLLWTGTDISNSFPLLGCEE